MGFLRFYSFSQAFLERLCFVVRLSWEGTREDLWGVDVLRAVSLGGCCKARPGVAGTLSNIGFSMRRKRFMTMMKASNSKGSAVLRVVKNLSAPADKGIVMHKRRLTGGGSRRLAVFEEEGVNFVFRGCGLIPVLGICRGVILPMRLSKSAMSRKFVSRMIRVLTLRSGLGGVPGGLSKKRRREITVTETLITGPTVILTSRPANGLSSGADTSIVKLVGQADCRFRRAIMVVARGGRVTQLTSQVIHVRSKGVMD